MRENKKPIDISIIIKKIEICKKCGMEIVFAHLPIDERLNNFWKGEDESYFQEIKRDIEILNFYGIDKFVMHSYYKNCGVELNDNIIKFFIRLRAEIDKNIEIYIENVDFFEQDRYVFENLKGKYKFCYDIGHENCFYTAPCQKDYITKNFSKDIGQLHLHDNNGQKDEHKIPFSENCNVDFSKLSKLDNIDKLKLVLESKMEKSEDDKKAREFLKSASESIDKIVENLRGKL